MRNVVLILAGVTLVGALSARCLFQKALHGPDASADETVPYERPSDPFPRAGKQRPVFTPRIQSASKGASMQNSGINDAEELKLILSEAKQAFGYSRLAGLKTGVVASGRVEGEPVSTPVRYSFVFGSRGRFVERLEGGLNAVFGYDGATTWALAWTRSSELKSLEASSARQLAAWVRSGHWLATPSPFEIRFDRPHSDGGQVALGIRGSGFKEALLYLDRATWLPTQLLVNTAAGMERWTFEEYAPVRGVQVARQVGHEGTGSADRFALTDVVIASAKAAELFEPLRFQAGRLNANEPPRNAPI